MNLFYVTPDGRFEVNLFIILVNHSVIQVFGIIIRKGFSKRAKFTEISAFSENCFFGNKTQVISKGHQVTSEAYFIKWTTSGETPVGSKSHQDSKWGHSKAIHYFTN